ncbi:unnamed protein product, partial [marine sediment metagenome]
MKISENLRLQEGQLLLKRWKNLVKLNLFIKFHISKS